MAVFLLCGVPLGLAGCDKTVTGDTEQVANDLKTVSDSDASNNSTIVTIKDNSYDINTEKRFIRFIYEEKETDTTSVFVYYFTSDQPLPPKNESQTLEVTGVINEKFTQKQGFNKATGMQDINMGYTLRGDSWRYI